MELGSSMLLNDINKGSALNFRRIRVPGRLGSDLKKSRFLRYSFSFMKCVSPSGWASLTIRFCRNSFQSHIYLISHEIRLTEDRKRQTSIFSRPDAGVQQTHPRNYTLCWIVRQQRCLLPCQGNKKP